MDLPRALIVALPLLALWIWCLIDVAQADDEVTRRLSKVQWMWLVILLNVVGGLLWLAFGRPRR